MTDSGLERVCDNMEALERVEAAQREAMQRSFKRRPSVSNMVGGTPNQTSSPQRMRRGADGDSFSGTMDDSFASWLSDSLSFTKLVEKVPDASTDEIRAVAGMPSKLAALELNRRRASFQASGDTNGKSIIEMINEKKATEAAEQAPTAATTPKTSTTRKSPARRKPKPSTPTGIMTGKPTPPGTPKAEPTGSFTKKHSSSPHTPKSQRSTRR